MKLNIYFRIKTKSGKYAPGVTPVEMTRTMWQDNTADAFTATLIREFREGDKDAKTKLPAVCWTGVVNNGGTRKVENMTPTGLYMIDIDHISKGDRSPDPEDAWKEISIFLKAERLGENKTLFDAVRLAHITPSGDGLRLVMQCTQPFETLPEHMQWLNEKIGFNDFGDFDTAVKDISRLSFIPQASDILYESNLLWSDEPNYNPIINGNVNGNGNGF